jgi:hypothetical protein
VTSTVALPKRLAHADRHPRRGDTTRTAAALAGWSVLVASAAVWGERVIATGDRLRIHAPPLTGSYDVRIDTGVLPTLAVATVAIAAGPLVARQTSWRRLVVVAALASVAWAVALALVDGPGALTEPLVRGQYIRTVPRVGDPLHFLTTFVDRLATYNIHTQGHPPGMVLVLWALERLGLGGVGWNAVLVFAGGGAATAAVLVATREIAGEAAARAAAPFLVLTPAAIWWSSGDAFFAGVSAWSVALTVLATGRRGRASGLLAAAGGVLFGCATLLSYGLVLVGVIPLFAVWSRRRPDVLAFSALGALVPLAGALAAGFSWIAGLAATHGRYYAGVARRRPYSYFVVGNLAAFAIAAGPAAAVALGRLRNHAVALLVVGGLAAIALADLSGLSKAEVERIWLPFVPWVVVSTAVLGPGIRGRITSRWWLTTQAVTAAAVAVTVRSPW